MAVDGAVGDDALVTVHRVHELIARVDTTRMIGEHLEQLELHGREIEVLASDRRAMAGLVELHAGPGRWLTAPGPSQDRLDAGDDLARAEWLADVVGGAQLQPEQPVDLVDTGGGHDDRHVP